MVKYTEIDMYKIGQFAILKTGQDAVTSQLTGVWCSHCYLHGWT